MNKIGLAFIFEVLQKYKGKYQSWKLTEIAGLGEFIKITFGEEDKMYIPLRVCDTHIIDNLPNKA
jgi:hypothetical protein